ncbi:MAG: FAD binding domain-containing protein, partial [Cohaesibacteraceae bacterium]|nr:FAD binding domain-containing protein [Cohaesibacteraceae bacterium]
MIPGQFSYLNPASKAEALKMLADGGQDARPLAGGHSLIPMMKLRMAQPSQLIDIAKLDELRRIEISRS